MSAGAGWLALVGGGEFSFGETLEADRAWLDRTPDGPVGFVPAASGSADYGRHFADYLRESFGREVETIPIYRPRDAKRARNAERLASCSAIYLGGGIADQLVEAIAGTAVGQALHVKLETGGVVAAVAAAAQACGSVFRSLRGGRIERGLELVSGFAIETNFDPAHDRRMRTLLSDATELRGVGIPSGSALLIGADGRFEAVGDLFALAATDADLVPFLEESAEEVSPGRSPGRAGA
jgi:cyanophycinase